MFFFLINFAYRQNLSKKEPHYEKPFYGRLYSGEKLWLCLAKKGDEAAQRICQSYYQQERGTEPPREGESGYIYCYRAPHL